MFYNCTGLSSIDTSAFTQVTNAYQMFSYCTGLTSIDTSAFTQVTDASYMFLYCSGLTSINTKAFTQVTDAHNMFESCTGLTSIDTSGFTQVTNASYMFYYCTGLTSINWGSIKPTTNTNMFSGASAAKKIGVADQETADWIKANETSMKLTNYSIMTSPKHNFTKVYNYDGAPESVTIQIEEGTTIDYSETPIRDGFNFTKWTLDIEGKIEAPTVMGIKDITVYAQWEVAYFKKTYAELDSWIPTLEAGTYNVEVDCTGVTPNQFMGDYANKRPSPFGNKLLQAKPDVFFNIMFNLPNEVVDTISCFDSRSASIPLKSVEITTAIGLTSSEHMFENCTLLENVDLRSLTSLSSSRYMFQGCSSLKNIDLSPLSQVSDASSMFYNCSGLTTISGLEGLNSITKINYMFYGCTHLSSIDISSFTKVTSSESTFEGCTGLIEVNWGSITPATNTNMFLGASSPKNIKIANKETETWLDSNDLNMKLVNYIINGVIPNNIYIGDLDGLVGHFKNELYRITVNLNNITQDALYDMGPLSTTLNKSVQGAKFNLTLNGNSSIIDLDGFLSNSSKITSITLNDFSNVTDISNLCTNDTSLTSVSLGQLSSVEIAPNAFQGCTSLQEIDISSMENIINISEIFSGCTNLQKVTWGNLYPISYWGAFSDVSENININLTDPDMKDILGGYEMDLPPTAKIGGILKVVFTKIETDKEYITMRDGEKKIIIPNAYYEEVKKPENGISISKWCKDINDVSIEGYSSHTPSCEQKYKDRLASSSFESITFPHSGSLNTNALYKIIIPYSNHREIYDYIKSNKNIIEVEITGTTKEIDFSLFSECNNIRFIQLPLSVEKLKGILPQNVFKIKYMGLSDKLLSDFDNKLVLEEKFIECADKKGFIRIPR